MAGGTGTYYSFGNTSSMTTTVTTANNFVWYGTGAGNSPGYTTDASQSPYAQGGILPNSYKIPHEADRIPQLIKHINKVRLPELLEGVKKLELPKGYDKSVKLPDGTMIELNSNGNFTINDRDAKVIYKGNRNREFNRFINASDLLEDFIGFLGSLGARQDQVLEVPVNMFIHWLIIKAAEKDGEEPPQEIPQIEHHPAMPKKVYQCSCCGKFISKEKVKNGVNFCNGACMDRYWVKVGKAA